MIKLLFSSSAAVHRSIFSVAGRLYGYLRLYRMLGDGAVVTCTPHQSNSLGFRIFNVIFSRFLSGTLARRPSLGRLDLSDVLQLYLTLFCY